MIAIVFAALGSLCNASSAVVQRLANVSAPAEVSTGWRKALYLIRQPMWLIGLLFLVGTFAFTATALYFGEIAVVQPVLVIELIFMLGLRRFWLHDPIAMRTWGAAAITCVGLAGFLVAAHPQEGIGLPSAGGWIKSVSIRVAIVLVLLALSRGGSPSRKAAVLGSSGAIVWSIDAGFMKAATAILSKDGWIHLLYHWPLYALVVTGIIGTVLVQASLSVGPLMVSQAALLIVDPFSSILLGVELFDEHVNHSPGAITGAVFSLVLMGTGVVLMSRWAPPVMEAHPDGAPDTEPGKVLLDGF